MPRKYKCREYTLDDGSVWTIPEIVSETNVDKNTIYWRLMKSDNKEYVFAPVVDISMRKPVGSDRTYAEERALSWVDKPTTVILGIPINPSYMDGLNGKDREGNVMSQRERASLMYYREVNRANWLKDKAV